MSDIPYLFRPEALLTQADFVRTLARSLIGDEHRAEDVAQETWLAALKSPPKTLGPGSIRSWLAAVTRNLARKTFRDESRERKKERAGARLEKIRSTAELLERETMRRRVVNAVVDLEEPYRSAILFRFYDDLPPLKIAERLEIPVETVNTRIQRGLKRLRKKLDVIYGGSRRTWCLALAPLARLDLTVTAAGASASTAAALFGALIMSTKLKIALVTAVLVAVTYLFWQLLPEEYVEEDAGFSPGGLSETSMLEEVDSPTIPEKGDVYTAEEGEEEREIVAPAGDQTPCIAGRAIMKEGTPLPPDLEITCLPRMPPFSIISFHDRERAAAFGIVDERELFESLDRPAAVPDENGSFLLKGVAGEVLYPYPVHPFVRLVRSEPVRPVTLDAIRKDKASTETLLVLEEGGVIEGVVLEPDGGPAPSVDVTLQDEEIPILMVSSAAPPKEAITPFTTTTSEEGRFRFEQVPANRRLVIMTSKDDCAPTFVSGVLAKANRAVYVPVILQPPASVAGVVENAAGRPLEGIYVYLKKSRIDLSMPEFGESNTSTDEDGRFVFTGLPSGTYILQLFDSSIFQAYSEEIELAAGNSLTDIRLVMKSGQLISGWVQDSRGEAVAGARVFIERSKIMSQLMDSMDLSLREAFTLSDESGAFSFHGVGDGVYDLNVRAPGFCPGKLEKVDAGTKGVTIVMERGGTLAGIALSGTDEEALTNYLIRLYRHEEGERSLFNIGGFENRSRHRIRNNEGRFEIADLIPGMYDLTFEADGSGSLEMKNILLESGKAVRGIIAVLPPESSVSGIVLDARTREPVEGVAVSQKPSGLEGRTYELLGKRIVHTDGEGRFLFGSLPEGPVKLTVSHPGYEEVRLEEIMLMEGESLEGLEILLSRGATIKGHVWTAEKDPVHGAILLVTDMTGSITRPAVTDEEGYYEVRGLSAGLHTVIKMQDKMSFGGKDFLSSFMKENKFQTVTLKKDEEFECDFIVDAEQEEGTRLTGIVREGNRPVSQAAVIMHEANADLHSRPAITSTDSEGRYTIEGVVPGDYILQVTKVPGIVGGGFLSRDIRVPDQTEFQYDVQLPGGSIRGIVRDRHTLSPLENVRVVLTKGESTRTDSFVLNVVRNKAGEAYTDTEGRFSFTNVPEGTYTIRAGGGLLKGLDSGGYALRWMHDVRIGIDQRREGIVIELEAGGILEGKVTNAAGLPVAGAVVYMKDASQKDFETWTECLSDGQGIFRYFGLNPGQCRLRIEHPEMEGTWEFSAWIDAGKTSTMDVTLE